MIDFNKYSFETLIKLKVKIEEIQDYFSLYEDCNNKFNESLDYGNTSPKQVFHNMAHTAIYVLYRSMFKEIEGERISFTDFTQNGGIIEAHKAIIYICDKDICHHDKNSKSFQVMYVDNLKNYGTGTIGKGRLSDEQLEIITKFLIEDILSKIEDALSEQLKKNKQSSN